MSGKVRIAWGFYTLFLFLFLQRFVEGVVARIPFLVGKIVGSFLIVVFTMDFLHSLYVEKKERYTGTCMED